MSYQIPLITTMGVLYGLVGFLLVFSDRSSASPVISPPKEKKGKKTSFWDVFDCKKPSEYFNLYFEQDDITFHSLERAVFYFLTKFGIDDEKARTLRVGLPEFNSKIDELNDTIKVNEETYSQEYNKFLNTTERNQAQRTILKKLKNELTSRKYSILTLILFLWIYKNKNLKETLKKVDFNDIGQSQKKKICSIEGTPLLPILKNIKLFIDKNAGEDATNLANELMDTDFNWSDLEDLKRKKDSIITL